VPVSAVVMAAWPCRKKIGARKRLFFAVACQSPCAEEWRIVAADIKSAGGVALHLRTQGGDCDDKQQEA
jgi:hypothetical protein